MISYMISRLVILVFGNLYPAYASYKAVRTKDVKEYVKWMMYWIVYALFTCAETFTDVLFAFWFPFYYELKIIFLIWILSPYTKGSSLLYRKFVHPKLREREEEIDEVIAHAKEQGCKALVSWGKKGVNYVRSAIMQSAIKGGGGLMYHLRKSYSLTDLADPHGDVATRSSGLGRLEEEQDVVDTAVLTDAQRVRYPVYLTSRRSGSMSSPLELYFSETDLDLKQGGKLRPRLPISFIQSTGDISSGYSSADALYSASAASTPTGDNDLNEVLLRTSYIESPRTRSRKPRTSSTNLAAVKQVSEGETSASMAEQKVSPQQLEDTAVTSPLLSQIIMAKFCEKQYPLQETSSVYSKRLCPAEGHVSPAKPKVNLGIGFAGKSMLCCADGENVDIRKRGDPESKDKDSGSSYLEARGANDTKANPKLSSNGDVLRISEECWRFKKGVPAGINLQDKNSWQGLRAGRYGKLRAPCPPTTHAESIPASPQSATQMGSVVNARMSLVSSKILSGSIDILIESDIHAE